MKQSIILLAISLLPFSVYSQTSSELVKQGDDFVNSREYIKAIEVYSLAIENDVSSSLAWFSRGKVYFYTENDSLAINDFTKAIELDSSIADIYYFRGKSRAYSGDRDGAHQDFIEAYTIDSLHDQANVERGRLFFYDGDVEFLWVFFERAIQIDSNQTANTYFLHALGFQESMAFGQALESYNKVLEIEPDNANAYSNKGNCLMRLNQQNEAKKMYLKAIGINPKHALANRGLGMYYHNLGENDEACKYWSKAKELGNPTSQDLINAFCDK